jgi:UDP-N-acetylmuramate dehydrogenase
VPPDPAIFGRVRGEVRYGEPLALHTSLKVGGPADAFVVPADRDDLLLLLANLRLHAIPYLLVGGGYNLLCRDGGFRGVAISLRRLTAMARQPDDRVFVEAGVSTGALTGFLVEEGLSGLEFLCGIPGSVGGALAMNAGAHGGATLDRVDRLTTWRDGAVAERGPGELAYGYRYLELADGEVVLAATFALQRAEPADLVTVVAELRARRQAAQQVGHPNAGSFFKNPPAAPAWQLIERAGLRGRQVGGAQVSEVHCNFLVNRGGATARDFLALAELVKGQVLAATGITLAEEVRIVGEE